MEYKRFPLPIKWPVGMRHDFDWLYKIQQYTLFTWSQSGWDMFGCKFDDGREVSTFVDPEVIYEDEYQAIIIVDRDTYMDEINKKYGK